MSKTPTNFTPLKELMNKNHEDRVQDYLKKMEGLSLSEIVQGSAFKTAVTKKPPIIKLIEDDITTPKQV